ncbi:MAG: hypothetical protein K2X87_08150 [Gemmataceae bacterium]|nr:hypothetical protein [Gemmataceae bacterium]
MDTRIVGLTPDAAGELVGRIEQLVGRLDRIESVLLTLARPQPTREWYGTAELSEILGKAEWTCREWCRLGRVRAEKRACGRGRAREWMVSHAELLRYQAEGLLPVPGIRHRGCAMGVLGLHGVPSALVPAEADPDDPIVAAGVDRVVEALGLDELDCFRFLDAHDALTGIVRDIVAEARSETRAGRPAALGRRCAATDHRP